jgi:16S rRNA (guanine(527)-N(7))-methyltransferase RsmG
MTPGYSELITKAALHLERIVEANQSFNLTRITSTREAVIKHVLDSVLPWKLFAGATHILDAGTGAGFPGIPLAIVLPDIRFILSESVGKKARFVEAAVAELGLANIEVRAVRAEEILLKSPRPSIGQLADITIEDCKAVDVAMTKCSKWLPGHDQAPAAKQDMPAPDELKADLDVLDTWIATIRKRW